MNHSPGPDPRFRAWLTERAPRLAPPDLLPRTMAQVAAIPQDGRWALHRGLLRFSTPAVAAILVLAAIGGGALLSRLPDVVVVPSPSLSAVPTPPVTPAPTPTPIPSAAPPSMPFPSTTEQASPSTGPAPTPPPALAFQQWTRHDMPDPAPDIFGGGTPIGVARIGDRYLAIGQEVSSPAFGGERVVRWTSSDGVSWDLAEGLPGLSVRAVTQLVSDGERAILIGAEGDDFGCCEAAAWVSDDGLAWTRAEGPVPEFVAAGPSGFVGAAQAGTFTRSADGRTWASFTGPFGGEVTGLAVDATGRAVAIGHRQVDSEVDGSSTTDLLIWRSPDGSTWGEPQTLLHDARASAVVAGPRGFVVAGLAYAYGRDGSVREVPRVWRLAGIGLDPAAIELGEGQSVDHIAAIGGTLVASGREQIEGVGALRVWVSSDGGDTWVVVPQQEAFVGINGSVRSIIAAPNGLVAVGQRLDPQAGHAVPVAWTSPR